MKQLISNQICTTTESMLSSVNIAVLNSATEKTLQQHNKNNGKLICVGCGGNCWYCNKRKKEIKCPNAKDPKVKARATA
eukprot:8629767-Ditylum_brightwellii.AAC.1